MNLKKLDRKAASSCRFFWLKSEGHIFKLNLVQKKAPVCRRFLMFCLSYY